MGFFHKRQTFFLLNGVVSFFCCDFLFIKSHNSPDFSNKKKKEHPLLSL